MRVNLGAAVFQESANARKSIADAGGILGSGRLCGGQKRLACAPSILVENEHRKNVAEQHAANNERDAAKDQQAACAHGSKSGGDIRR